MNSQELIEKLGYSDSPAFLKGGQLRKHHGYSFIFTQAEREDHCNLKGVYTLAPPDQSMSSSSLTPVVYVCEATNEEKAREIHRRVWNQNVVPFLIIVTPKNIRLYSGFEYDRNKSDEERVLKVAKDSKEVLSRLSAFTSEAIDSGDIWDRHEVTTESRVDRHLLKSLDKLSEKLTGPEYQLPVEHAHTLIGKYIYLKYLKDRGILSAENFSKAKVSEEHIFSRAAQKEKLYKLEKWLDGFLNGSVFPLPNKDILHTEHIRKVAAVFEGDDPESGQRFLFDMYDFSYVPIETLSVVYQQFLHQKGQKRSKGAYYTPVHLVNFILDELEAKKPLREGMKVFDPSCGSGAFLVQCYRRLVEGVVRKKGEIKPTELRKLLTSNIFGLDADEGACRVAELSLSLTLLDYIDPPDLSKTNFKLPYLHNQNIFYCEGGFFDDDSAWAQSTAKQDFAWIVGNPPWKNIDKKKAKEPYDAAAIEWIDANRKRFPIDNYQTAEAFAWKTTEFLKEDGQCGLLMPAMTLFKKQGDKFRAKFFSDNETWCVVNFSNIRRYLFEKAINPAAAFFYSGKRDWDKSNHYIITYTSFAIEQSSQLNQKSKTKKMWTIFVNHSTIKEIPLRQISNGSAVSWKIAMWGTHRDNKLLGKISMHNPSLEKYLSDRDIHISEGSQLRDLPEFETQEQEQAFHKEHEYYPTLVGKDEIDQKRLKAALSKQKKIALRFPPEATTKIGKNRAYLRKRGGTAGLSVSESPHIITSASRSYALYSDDYVFVSPRQVGISGEYKQSDLLKALTLYLHSDFIRYQQWLTSASLGVERDCVNLDSLKQIPVPFEHFSHEDYSELARLFNKIVEAERRERESQEIKDNLFYISNKKNSSSSSLESLVSEMNERVYDALKILKKHRALIEDMLDVRLKLNDGRIAKEATEPAIKKEIEDFARIFQDELDLFLDHSGKKKTHKINVLYGDSSVVMIVDHLKHPTMGDPIVESVKDDRIRKEMDGLEQRLGEKRSQWIYYRRCLRIYEGRTTYIFKPRQRLYWLKSQALSEADEFIEEKLATE
jgi:hypothetical protein